MPTSNDATAVVPCLKNFLEFVALELGMGRLGPFDGPGCLRGGDLL